MPFKPFYQIAGTAPQPQFLLRDRSGREYGVVEHYETGRGGASSYLLLEFFSPDPALAKRPLVWVDMGSWAVLKGRGKHLPDSDFESGLDEYLQAMPESEREKRRERSRQSLHAEIIRLAEQGYTVAFQEMFPTELRREDFPTVNLGGRAYLVDDQYHVQPGDFRNQVTLVFVAEGQGGAEPAPALIANWLFGQGYEIVTAALPDDVCHAAITTLVDNPELEKIYRERLARMRREGTLLGIKPKPYAHPAPPEAEGGMTRADPQFLAFQELVAMKYQLYNGLFLDLPFEDLADTGVQLPLFAAACREKLPTGKPPSRIVEEFFRDMPGKTDSARRIRVLFKFLQLVERQVVLFDALEDAAFPAVNGMDGPGSLSHLLSRIQSREKKELLARELESYRIRIVLTAHPTQFYPDSILGIITDLSGALAGDRIPAIHELLLQMGKTRFQNRQRPTPLEEARSLIWYLKHIFYPTLPSIQGRLLAALPEDRQDPFGYEPKVELGFWPGGDRDGNPYVTAETTLQVSRDLREGILGLYLEDLESLLGRLTFDGITQPLQAMRDRVQATLAIATPRDAAKPRGYASAAGLLADLRVLRRDLEEKHQGLFIDRLDDFIHKVQTFGFHFASLDLRQDSRVHAKALAEIFAGNGYAEMDDAGKDAFLDARLRDAGAAKPRPGLDPLSADTLASLAAVRAIQKASGEKALSRYVISNANSARNVLEVMALATLAGWKPTQLKLDIVPLFETIDDLAHAEAIMRELYAHPAYAAHLRRRGRTQTIMLGFSDGTKDGGYITANWAIFKAKRDLTRVSRAAGIKVVFFDGRGGPPSRGGGNTHKFYRSLGADIEHSEIHLTVQGQTISSNFGTPAAARFNVEQLFTAGLEDKLFPGEAADLDADDIRLLDGLSAASLDAYRRFREDPLFLPYLEEMTPLPYYNLLNIASRPARRKQSSLRFEDLRAIPFVGAWSQMKQNIPGYYGVGTALEKLLKQGKRKPLEELYRDSLFFRTLVENAMMSLSKSNFPLTRYLEKDPKYGKFWKRIYQEATLSKALLKEITGQQKLMETALAVRESIHLREKIIMPLLVIQQHAMGMVKAATRNPEDYPKGTLDAYAKMVVKAMAANINAARNSA